MVLFEKKTFKMHSGGTGHFKIECDALTDEDIETLAFIIAGKFKFRDVFGIPEGGIRIAKELEQYKSKNGLYLIVDDVLTTGNSMEEVRQQCYYKDVMGVVIFARGKCPSWIIPVFQLWKYFK